MSTVRAPFRSPQPRHPHIIRLSATKALQILDILRADDAWTKQGIVIGEPVTRIMLQGVLAEDTRVSDI
jgi:hypothetical protein